MQLVSNYPQVPLATSNPATDAARVEGQQRPPVIPPQQPAKGHEERAFNPQNERTADTAQQNARLATQVHERQQQSNQQQQQGSQEQKQQGKALFATMLVKPALDRKDIRNQVHKPVGHASPQASEQRHPLPGQSADFYRDFGSRIGDYYRQQTSPAAASSLEALA
ncbi:hypothetical protein [Shewanella dokdonensis]|uniref:Uncharacterized protein n=1 Tax=Shewanella dokdonensis TaxID=712036 RepID=A0ABX8DL69_9GAMM|nr:hypothetical protein [Shewanella dokdonensis]MCL1075519.1 hypothetical protein [Shewanella dokdonensis]QVK24547.1 hypothetical protein KHX94_08955 [Shewanella dokdonensis]